MPSVRIFRVGLREGGMESEVGTVLGVMAGQSAAFFTVVCDMTGLSGFLVACVLAVPSSVNGKINEDPKRYPLDRAGVWFQYGDRGIVPDCPSF